MNTTGQNMANEAKGIIGNAKQKMNQLSSQAQVEYRRTLGAMNTQIGKMKGKLSEAQQTALTQLETQKANLQAAHQRAMQGYVANDTGATFMNGFNQALAGSKKALEDAKKGVKAAKKFGDDVNNVRKKVASSIQIQDTSKAQGKVKGGPMSQAKRFGGRKRRTRRKRRKKGRKSRRKGRKSRRSRRKKRKGRKSRRKKRRTRRRR